MGKGRERPAPAGLASRPLLLSLLLISAGLLLSTVLGGTQALAAVRWAKAQALRSTWPSSRDELRGGGNVTCNVTLDIPKVALLFLTRGPMPHRDVWGRWLDSLSGLVPKSSLLAPRAVCLRRCTKAGCKEDCGPQAACYPACAAALREAYSARPRGWGHLLSVHTHANPAWQGYLPVSPFHLTMVRDRVATAWGTHALAEAARRLVQAAVADPANRWFVLASETTVPIYSAPLLWQQLAHESLSRIDACNTNETETMIRRSSPHMATPRFDPVKHWRKSGQWWMLNRRHAELVAGDEELSASFAARCRDGRDEELGRWRDCISDEHYVPSLLAMHGADNETNCDDQGGTHTDWKPGAMHPQQYGLDAVSRALIDELRAECAPLAAEATDAAEGAFLRVDSLSPEACVARAEPSGWLRAQSRVDSATLPTECNLLARKVAPAAAQTLWELYTDCRSGLGVVPCNATSAADAWLQARWQKAWDWMPGR